MFFNLNLLNFVLLPRSIKGALDSEASTESIHGKDLDEIVSNCIETFKNVPRYRNDIRFMKIWFLHVMNCFFTFSNSIIFIYYIYIFLLMGLIG